GERTSVASDVATAFHATGTSHLLAISGFNLTLVASAVGVLARGRLPPSAAACVGLAAAVAYAVVVGLQPSVLRATLMAAIAAAAVVGGRGSFAANALCGAVALLVIADPRASGDAGAVLSVAATAGLIRWQRPFAERFAALPPLIGEGLATTLAATLPTLPIVAVLFGRISLIAPLANLVAVPLFTPLLAFGAGAALLGSLVPDLARPLAMAAFGCAWLLLRAVQLFAAVPLASIDVPEGVPTGVVVVGVALAAARAARGIAPRALLAAARAHAPPRPSWLGSGWGTRWDTPLVPVAAAAAGVVLVVIGGTVAAPLVRPAPDVRILALDVGQGDAFLVEADGRLALIDGGPDPSRLLAQLGATLPPWRRRIDLIALTHAHLDHGAGLLAVLDRYEVGLAIEPVGLNEGALRDQWIARTGRAGVPRRAVRAGERIRLGAARITVLAPSAGDAARVDVPSLVLRVERGGFSALFMGDATDPALADLLLQPRALGADLYIPPHHGAETAYAAALAGAVRPRAALLSLGAGNRYGHPAPGTIAALRGVPTYRTDRDGTVEVATDGPDGSFAVKTKVNGLGPPRRGVVPYVPAPR
ncbi:MAG: MBL fold metallo-hydrolase, partial [Chloroflexi bacterium]|nr:MBL fold metallo-hydrolase [Chloroflexota bacterium]